MARVLGRTRLPVMIHPHRGVLRPAVAVVEVLAVVGDYQQSAPGRDAVRGRAHYLAPLIGPQLQVEDQHEIECAWFGSVIQQVGSDSLWVRPSLCCRSSRFFESGLREVESRRVPPALREPDRVAAFAAGEVESSARRQARRLRDEEAVGFHVQMNSLSA